MVTLASVIAFDATLAATEMGTTPLTRAPLSGCVISPVCTAKCSELRHTWPNKVTETSVDFRTDVQIGVQATFHLADPARRQNVVAAQAGYEKARLHTQELQQQIAREIATALFRVQEIEQTLAQAQMHLEQLETNLAVVRERLAQGLAVAQDAAEQELNVAQQVGRIRQLAGERVIAYLTLWHAAGLDAVALQIPAF
jgi:outer membrane protein TolC